MRIKILFYVKKYLFTQIKIFFLRKKIFFTQTKIVKLEKCDGRYKPP